MWTIQLLGGLTAHSPQREITRFRTQKAASLLAYLAFHPAPQPREMLLDLLWPDAEPEVGRHNLSNALSFLRHQLEPTGVPPGTVILADRASVRLNPAAVTVDAIAFEKELSQTNAEGLSEEERLKLLLGAVERYRGALLPGSYEEWVTPEALRLEGLFVDGVLRLVPLLLGAGRHEVALAYAQRAVILDPLSEEATRCLMQAWSASSQPVQALRAYRALATRLQEELHARPSETLQCLAEQLGQKGASPISPAMLKSPLPIEEGFALVAASRNRAVPAESALDTAVVSLPAARLVGGEFLLRTTTRFFGREEEIDRLSKMLSTPRTRLVTLTGPGGTGKTRLALEVAAQLVEKTADIPEEDAPTSVVFVPLASITEPGQLFEVILRALGIVPAPNLKPLDQLANVLADWPNTLLVLDNFEQLVEEGALCVHDLLGKVPSVKLLITSRQRLQIKSEREFHLAPLPTSAGAQTPEELMGVPGIALFVDRAQSALPDFHLTERNAVIVSQLCDYLEGIPLAIEMAAARVSVLSPSRILEQVQANRLDFLATRRRDAESRQKTLRATMDWSYLLLPDSARTFLAALSVFRGGWTLEAAQAMCGSDDEVLLEFMTMLRDSSLIAVNDTEDGLRFTMLETIREYASEQLDRRGERKEISRRHQAFFLALAQSAEYALLGAEQGVWLHRLETEHENLRAALTWSLKFSQESRSIEMEGSEAGSPRSTPVPLRFCIALQRFWYTRGHLQEGRELCSAALQAQGAQERTAARAKTLDVAGGLARAQGDYHAARAYQAESVTLFREIGDRQGVSRALTNLGAVESRLGDPAAARGCHEEALAIQKERGDRFGSAHSLNNLGTVAIEQDDYAAARGYYAESVTLFREIGDRQGVAASLNNLGIAASEQGDYAAARGYQEEALAIQQEGGDRPGSAYSLNSLGMMALDMGDYAAARGYHAEGVTLFREIGDRWGLGTSLNNLGITLHHLGDDAAATALLEESLAIRRQMQDRWAITYSLTNLGLVAHHRGNHHVARELFAESLTIKQGLGERRGIPTVLECMADLAASEEQSERAARLWGAAEALRQAIRMPMPPGLRVGYEASVAVVREALGETAFVAVWEAGRAMTLEQAIAYALEGNPSLS